MHSDEQHDQLPSELQKGRSDVLAAVARSASGILPVIGATVGEVLTAIIPNQRAERIIRFLAALDQRVKGLEKEVVEKRMRDPEYIDLFEDGMIQAARALSDERRERIAALLKNSLTRDDLRKVEQKKLLSLLASLNDAELLILQSYSRAHFDDHAFVERHSEVLHGPQAHLGSSAEEIDRDAVHRTYRAHLADLALLRPRFKKPRRGELPEFDEKTGRMKASGYEITGLGDLLLRYLDLSSEG